MHKGICSMTVQSLVPTLALAVSLSMMAHAKAATAPVGRSPAVARAKPVRPGRQNPSSFTPETTFAEAIDILRHSTTPPINIVVLWNDVGENAGIYRDTPIGIDGVPGLHVRQYLDLLTLSLSAGASARLGYVVNKGVVTIGTVDSLPRPKYVTRVYDVSDLVAPPAQYFRPPMMFGGMGYGGQMGTGGFGGGYGTGGVYGGGSTGGFTGGLYGNRGGSPYGR